MLFLLSACGAAYLTVAPGHPNAGAAPFSHIYPPDPAGVERPAVSGFPPPVASGDIVRAAPMTSFAQLGHLVSKDTLRQLGHDTWLLSRPIAVAAGASLTAVGPGSLEIGPHAYLETSSGGAVTIRNFPISPVDDRGRPATAATPGRGFLVANRGQLVLSGDSISSLGELAPLSYGVSLEAPTAGSLIEDCAIDGGYIGVYLTHAAGVQILRNRVTNSLVYGIDPHTGSSSITIEGNDVQGSGVHGIVLAQGVHGTQVVNNVVSAARDHGIVLFGHADGNVVAGNRVEASFDGIVVTDSSNNQISANTLDGNRRFGLRLSGASVGNSIRGNLFAHELLGVYLYGGSTGNLLAENRFVGNYEDARIRTDAPGNRLWPVPAKSEIRP